MKNPKYVTVKEALITRIRAGAYSEDDPLLSEAELSVAYHASRNTIRQALKELENEGYIYRARGKGPFIRTCSSVNSQKIALLIYDTAELQSSVTMKMIAGLSETLEEAGFLLDILASHRTFQKENITRLAVNYGGFVIGTSHLDALTIGELGKLAIPHIFVKNYLPHMHDTSVRVDFARAGFLAACHLIDCGCRTLGVVYPGRQIPIASDFFDGVCAAALDQGVQLRKEHIFTTGSYVCDAVTQAAEILAADADRPHGVIAASDTTASMLLEVFAKKGIRIPEDIQLTGCNDTSRVAKMTVPPLTTVRLPMREAGHVAGLKIMDMIRGIKTESVVLQPELILRGSTSGKE